MKGKMINQQHPKVNRRAARPPRQEPPSGRRHALIVGEIIKIGELPFRYVGNGAVEGVSIAKARKMRDELAKPTGAAGATHR